MLIGWRPLGAGALLEIIWSATPAAILVAICSTSLKVLKHQLHVPSKPSVTVEVVVHQGTTNTPFPTEGWLQLKHLTFRLQNFDGENQLRLQIMSSFCRNVRSWGF
ncbi:MAG: hypothetical protein ACTS6A_02255 [Candidatus Hodgkinia cicadicola]